MKKKGFTLIELLAVLVILAIIALITIPIVIRTINNSEEEAEKKSILGYARAVEDDIANYMMINAGKKYTDYVLPDNLDYKGNEVECDKPIKPDANGKLKLTCCKVVGGTGTGYDYENGKVEKSTDTRCNAKEEENQGNNHQDETSKTAVDALLDKTNDADASYEGGSAASHQMYAFEHPQTEQTEALTDYRYIGNDPYNYVEFNGETWRIIGIFTVEDENGNRSQRIKIIRDNILIGNMAWDSTMVYEYDWPTSIINNYLNGEYYAGLSSDAKELIEPAKIYLGGGIYNNTTHYGTAADRYVWERGTARYYDSISLNDINNISLIYPSDYLYTFAKGIDDTCFNDGSNCSINLGGNPSLSWLYTSFYLWTISPQGDFSDGAFAVFGSGIVSTRYVYESYLLRPVTYLKSTVKIASGTGTSSDPYKLKI
jgi:prepilin-type N-terminal cleavage/methylation domain-containing protein